MYFSNHRLQYACRPPAQRLTGRRRTTNICHNNSPFLVSTHSYSLTSKLSVNIFNGHGDDAHPYRTLFRMVHIIASTYRSNSSLGSLKADRRRAAVARVTERHFAWFCGPSAQRHDHGRGIQKAALSQSSSYSNVNIARSKPSATKASRALRRRSSMSNCCSPRPRPRRRPAATNYTNGIYFNLKSPTPASSARRVTDCTTYRVGATVAFVAVVIDRGPSTRSGSDTVRDLDY
ncbi:hypothetical protein EVAR_47480_1 [Eumeta japonica]|uniref:Uncharacterized protein n=1 Tax=Eumeta variegata TaxID=151549 RepID=A0A4C1XCR7_EUMVA|nr:hypothetical protein EVAR_47480_1 [Eumeta japonica]